MPPNIVEQETSPSLVVASEFEPLRLSCKVAGEPQSQLVWRREDGKSLDALEQRFRHQLERRPGQLLSLDSSELIFDSFRREQVGAYLVSWPPNGQLATIGATLGRIPLTAREPCPVHRLERDPAGRESAHQPGGRQVSRVGRAGQQARALRTTIRLDANQSIRRAANDLAGAGSGRQWDGSDGAAGSAQLARRRPVGQGAAAGKWPAAEVVATN